MDGKDLEIVLSKNRPHFLVHGAGGSVFQFEPGQGQLFHRPEQFFAVVQVSGSPARGRTQSLFHDATGQRFAERSRTRREKCPRNLSMMPGR